MFVVCVSELECLGVGVCLGCELLFVCMCVIIRV